MSIFTLLRRTPLLNRSFQNVYCQSRLLKLNSRWKSNFSAVDDVQFTQILHEQMLYSTVEHNVLIIQPSRKYGSLRMQVGTEDESFEEAKSLIDTLGDWEIIDATHVQVRHNDTRCFFTSGHFETLTEKIRSSSRISAVFINWPVLSGLQVCTLQKAWRRVVFDRYSLVLQIFKKHANTDESRLQVSLAEIPHLRSRLHGFHEGELSNMKSDFTHALNTGGSSPLEEKRRILDSREHHLNQMLRNVQKQRAFLRQSRRKREIPLVSILGYTNAGKTSLIRNLTGDTSMTPRNQLFATLDVTNHKGRLPNSLSAIFVDTIGFIADIPTSLISAFTTMINDCLDTDLIVHVIDISNSDWPAQWENVDRILRGLGLSQHLANSIIHVATKTDRLSSSELQTFTLSHPEVVLVSNSTLEGLVDVGSVIQEAIISNLSLVRKNLRVIQGGSLLSWLRSEATIEKMQVCPQDSEKVLVKALFSPKNWGRFQTKFYINSKRDTPS